MRFSTFKTNLKNNPDSMCRKDYQHDVARVIQKHSLKCEKILKINA